MPPRTDQLPGWSRRLLDLADRDPRRAVRLARRAAEGTPWDLFTQGWALLVWERLAEAQASLGAARKAFAGLPGALGPLLCDYGLLLVDQRQLARQGFEVDLAGFAERFDEQGEPALATRARLDQARQLNVLGRLYESEAVLERLERSEPPLHPVDMARLLRVRAVASYLHGDYYRAVMLLDEAEGRFRQARLLLELARCWFERAAVAVNQEHLDETLAQCARAEEVFRRFDLPLQRAFCLKVGGFAAIRQGHYDQAFRHTRRALELFHGLGRERDVGACTLNLGNIYYHTGSWAAALDAYARAEEHFVAAGMIGHQLTVRRNCAMVERAMGRLDEATALLSEAEAQAVQLGFQAETAEIRAVQAALLADQGRVPEAVGRYDDAHALFLRLDNKTAAAECRLELGWLALRSGDHVDAEAHFAAAAPALRGRGHHAWRVGYGQARCAELAGAPALALHHYAEACATIGSLRKRLSSEILSSDLYAQATRLHADALLLAVARHDPLAALGFVEGQRALTIQQLILAQLASGGPGEQVADADPWLLSEATVQGTLDLDRTRDAIRSAYGDDWTALVYALVDDALVTVCVTGEGLLLERRPFDAYLRRVLERATRPEYRYYTYNDLPFLQKISPEPWAGLSALAELLLPAPVRERLHPDHRLLIVPAGSLHMLPWGALRVGGRWLIERAIVQLLPSLSVTPLLLRPRGPAPRALAVGCSTFGGRAADLPGVAAELAAVAEVWPGACERCFEGDATREGVFGAVGRGAGELALVHVASHAQLLASRGLAAHIKLWDGDLLLPEIARLRLAGALVVLSACDGAAADVLPGEEVLSLTWAFLSGGAGAVVASLWPVSDLLAPAIMRCFYRQALAVDDPSLALARAQRRLIGGAEGEALAQVVVWGALQAVGGRATQWTTTGGTAPPPLPAEP